MISSIKLIRKIILLSLPTVKLTTYRERYDLLLALSLVNSKFRIIAQEELFKHLVFKGANGLKLISKEIRRRKEKNLVSPILSVTLNETESDESFAGFNWRPSVLDIFTYATNSVQEVFIRGFNIDMIFDSKICDWNSLTSLTKLHLIEVRFMSYSLSKIDFKVIKFPTLTHLTLMKLSDYTYDKDLVPFFEPFTFPYLTSIAFLTEKKNLSRSRHVLPEAIPINFSQQLKKLLIYESKAGNDVVQLKVSDFPLLENLSLRDSRILQEANFQLERTGQDPATIATLHTLSFLGTMGPFNEDMELVADWVEGNDLLQRIRTIKYNSAVQYTDPDEQDLAPETEKFFFYRDITFQCGNDIEEEQLVELLESILEEQRRYDAEG